jgi:hypothetical protein
MHAVVVILERPPRAGNFITTAVALISRAARKLAQRDSSIKTNWRAQSWPGSSNKILTPTNIRSYIQRVMESAIKSKDKPSPEQDVVRSALSDLQTRLQRWENALESGELSIEHAAQRIKELHEQRQELLKKKQALDHNGRSVKTVSAIPTARMDAYVAEMQRRLAAKQIGAKREFLQELLKEVRVHGSNVTLTYKLPLAASEWRFFTPLRLVGPPGLEPGQAKKARFQ